MLAAKHLDPVLGIDVHIVLVPTPAGPVPTPVPHPFVGMLFDPQDYVPGSGATVLVNGLPRAHAGTTVLAIPHVPIGGVFLKPPANTGEMYMGSATVIVEGEPMSYALLPVLSCSDIGMAPPARKAKKGSPKALFLPTSLVMPLPSGPPVLIGGSPTVSMPGSQRQVGAAAKRLAKQIAKAKKLAGPLVRLLERKAPSSSRYLNRLADKVFDKLELDKAGAARNAVRRAICTVTGHPVDVASGKLFTDFVDLELLGPLPFKLERVWYSTSTYDGPLGHGWHASFDMALSEDEHVVGIRLEDGRMALFPALQVGHSHFHRDERLTLHRDRSGYRLCSALTGLTYQFASTRGGEVLPLAAIQDRNGHTVSFRYDDRARLCQIVDSGGRTWQLVYASGARRIVEIVGPDPRASAKRIVYARYAYDGRGNLSEVRDVLDQPQRFRYQRHLLVQETNRNGLSFYFAYDACDESARCVRTWGDGGIYDHKLTYEVDRKLTTVENSLGHKTLYEHDGAMVSRTIDAFGNTRLTRHGDGYAVLEEVDELGQRTRFAYDERGNLTVCSTPDGAETALRYDEHDLPSSAIDALGGTWTWKRDRQGRVVEEADPLGSVTKYHYQGPWLVAVVDAAGARTTRSHGPSGDLEVIASADGGLTRLKHDPLGRLVWAEDPAGAVQRRELDVLGRAVRIAEPDGNLRELAYDGEDNVVHVRDRLHDVRFTYQGMNRLASRSEAGTVVRFGYDTEEQLTSVVNEHGAVYSFVLGPTGQVDEERGFDGLMRKYTRDAAGRVLRVDRPGERFSAYEHDAAGRVVAVTHSDGSEERYVYAADGAMLEAENADATIRFARDALGRVHEEWRDEHVVQSAYDPLGRRVRMTSSLGAKLAIERNALGDVERAREAASGFETTFTRDMLGRELARALPGGVRSKWQRDATGRPLEHVVTASAETLRAVGYTWEVSDRLTRLVDGVQGTTAYRHDARGNLAWAGYSDGSAELRMPDAAGNLFRTEQRGDRKYGPAGQLLVSYTPHGETRYAYDLEGNLVEKREPGGSLWRYDWNAAGMLSKVTRPDGSAVTFAYDALGRRIAKTYRGQTTRWVWDGNVPLHEWVEGELISLADAGGVPWATADAASKKRDAELAALLAQGSPARGSGEKPITWLFEPESFAPMARLCGGDVLSIICDHLGTPVLMVDGDGQRAWRAGLSAWGELRALEGDRYACPFRWPGQYEDAETGLYYNRFRYYDAESGQYASQDPIGLAGGLRIHGYVSDPLAWTDPLGLSGCPPDAAPQVFQETSRRGALALGQRHAQVPRLSKGGEIIPFGELAPSSRGRNFAELKLTGARGLGRKDARGVASKAEVFDHPDGHPNLVGSGQPKHHKSPHVHATNSKGETIIVTYPGDR
jgi:RHS repeat-associated protein